MTVKKKLLAVALGVTCCLSLAGCGGDSGKQEGGTADKSVAHVVETTDVATQGEKKDWKIAVVVKDSSNGWFARMDEGVKQYAADTGIRCSAAGAGHPGCYQPGHQRTLRCPRRSCSV